MILMADSLFSASIDRWLLDPRYRTRRYGLYWSLAGLLVATGLWDSLRSVTERVEPAARPKAYGFEVGYAVAILGALAFNLSVLIPRVLLKTRQVKLYLGWVLLIGLVFSVLDTLPFGYKLKEYVTRTPWQLALEVCEGVVFVGSLLVSIAVLTLLKTWIHDREHIRQLQTDSLRNELAALKAQINPHFLFNTLNAIHVLAKLRSPVTADALVSLADLMRYQFHEDIGDWIRIEDEVQYVENLLTLERLRKPATDVQLRVSGLNGQFLAPFLLLPFIENAFKHGSATPTRPGPFIYITLEAVGDAVRFKVENSYVRPRKPVNGGGIGLANVRRRLELLYPNRYELAIDAAECRFTVELHLTRLGDRPLTS